MKKKILSLVLSVSMLFSSLPAEAFAVSDVPCGHHSEHTPDCGYTDPIQAVPCGHICDEVCYSTETACLHIEHDETCGGMEDETLCAHVCSEENGCITRSQNCQHVHDEACGYTEGSEGTPCLFVCQDCAPSEDPAGPETPADAAEEEAEDAAPVQPTAEAPAPVAETANIAWLNVGDLWSASLYDYAVWAWPDDGDGHWVFPTGAADANGWIPFEVEEYPNVIFAAIKKGQATDWSNKVFQTVDLRYDPETPYFTLAAETNSEGKFSGTWGASSCSHAWTEETVTEATCTQAGLIRSTCSLCGNSYDQPVPMLPHTPGADKICTVCGFATNKIFLAWEYILDSEKYDVYLRYIVANVGVYNLQKDPVSAQPGYSSFTLPDEAAAFYFCIMPEGGDPEKEDHVASSPTIYRPESDPYYTFDGWDQTIKTFSVSKNHKLCDHQWYTDMEKPSGCTGKGELKKVCSLCDRLSYLYILGTGHSEATAEVLKVTTPATCTADGAGTYICAYCSQEIAVTIPATGHSPVPEDPEKLTVVTVPDCNTDGESTYLCEECSETVSVTVPTTGHNYQPIEMIASPGCTTAGSQIYECINPGCGDQIGRDIPALGHDLDENHICKRCSQEATILLTAADGSTAYYIGMFSALQEANNIPGGATILLLKDTTWYEEYSPGEYHLYRAPGPVILDLNDCTLTYENPNGYTYDYYDSELTVKNGSLYVEYGTRIFNLNNCRFTMENVTVATHLGFADLVRSIGSQSRITMTGVTLECNASWSALNLNDGTAELTDCIFYTGTEASSDDNTVRVGNTATLRINSGRYKHIYSVEEARSVYEFIDTAAHDYRRFNGFHCYTDGYSLGREVSDVDVVPVPFKAADPPELPETQIGRPVTLVPAYTPNVEDFEPEQMELVWYFIGPEPPYTEHEDGSVTITPSEAGTVTARCCYSYQNYSIIKTYEFTVTGCTAHSYDSQGLCRYCKVYQPAEDTDADGYLEITNPGNLWWFSQQVNNGNTSLNAVLTANIDLSTTCGEGIGNWQPIGNNYSGHFNGQGHTVSNLYMTGHEQYIGLFGYVKDATIENVTVTGSVSSTYFSDESYMNNGAAGGVVAYLYGGTIRNCHVDMTVVGGHNIGGICGYLNNGFIENCTADGTVMNHSESDWTGQPVGGIVGTNKGTVRDCVNMATVTNELMDRGACLGGIAGHNENILERCTNFGSVTGKNFNQGGIAGLQFSTAIVRDCCNHGTVSGYLTGGIVSDNMGTIEDCYNVGAVSGTSASVAPVANSRDSDASVTNCYYLSDTETSDGGRTADQFASGQVAYELNGSVTEEANIWRQTIGTDAYPVFSGALVYYGTYYQCDGTSLGESYSNSVPGAIPDHSYGDNGLCTVCRHSNTPAVDSDGDGYYEIDTPAKLWWFTQQVNGGKRSLNAVLTADIDLSTTCGEGIGNWMPIGNEYSGHFNGQGFTISGIYMTGNEQYAGLFGRTQKATIENLTVTGSVRCSLTYIEKNWTSAGGIVAYAWGGTIRNCHVNMTVSGEGNVGGICAVLDSGTIEGCTSRGTVECLGTDQAGVVIGGIVGSSSDSSTVRGCINEANIIGKAVCSAAGIVSMNYGAVENCTNLGSIGGDKSAYTGGIVASNYGTVKNCANRGTVSGGMTGGIAGGNSGAIENCYHAGTISGRTQAEPILGYPMTGSTVTNCYYLSDTETSDGGRTADQFASGQVTYELNGSVTADTNVWRQTIGTDAYPVFSGALVYYGGTFHCDGSSIGIFYHNEQPDTSVPPHTINRDTGICTACTQRVGYLRITTGNTDHYAMTLAEAAALAGSEAATITLLENMGTAEAPADGFGSIACGWLTFDLNGKTLLYDGYPFVNVTSGRLTVVGTGTIRRSADQMVRFQTNGGSVRLQGGTYPNGLVSSYVQIRDLLDDGYLFKTAVGWQPYDLAAGSFANTVSVSVLPSPVHISQVPNRNSMEITQGDKRILSMRAEPLDPADTVTYEWIAGDTTSTEADFDLSVLPVGTYSLKLTIRCGDVAVYVQYISLTVNPCAHTDMPNGFCSFCGSFAPAELKDGVYQIANGGNLFWFAAMVNGDSTYADFDAQNTKANAVLTADIDLENREWTPIHKYEFASFDGQGHTISGFSMTTTANAADHDYHGKMLGLFGWIDSCTIQNFTLRGSMNITDGGMTGNGRLGTIVGVCDRDSVISGISSHVSVKIAYEVAYAGGIVGGHYAGAVSQCIAYGDLESDASFREAGGIAGYVQSGSFDNCGFYGGVFNASQHAGGIIGLVDDGGTNVRNCCVSATVRRDGKDTGAIIGHAKANSGIVENNYFDPGWGIENAFGSTSSFTFTETAAYAKPDTAFCSGEVAWLLNGSQDNGTWKQTIDGWNYQPNFSALPVYRWEPDEVGGAYTYGNTPEPPAVISVDITWGDLAFTYTDGTWNPDTLTYEGQGWTADTEGGNAITVKNSGSEAVSVSVSYTPADGYTGISGSFGETSATLAGEEEKKFWLLLSGKPENEISSVPIGTVTVMIGGE